MKFFFKFKFLFVIFAFSNCQTFEPQTLHKNFWKQKEILQLVFKHENKKGIPVSLAREQGCALLKQQQEQNVKNYLQHHFVFEEYRILKNLFSVDRYGNCMNTVLIKVKNPKAKND